MSRLALAAFAACSILALAACDQYGAEPLTEGRVRLVNVSPDAPPLALELDGEILTDGITYASSSEYDVVSANRRNDFIVRTGTGTQVGQVSLSLRSGADYSIVAYRLLGQLRVSTLQDLTTPAPQGEALIRTLHTANSLGAVDLYITAGDVDDISAVAPIVGGLGFEFITNYLSFASGSRRVRVTDVDTKDVLADSGALALISTGVYTVYIIESPGGGEPYEMFVVVDSDES